MISSFVDLVLTSLENEFSSIQGGPVSFVKLKSTASPEIANRPQIGLYSESLNFDNPFKEGPPEEKEKRRILRHQYQGSMIMEIFDSLEGECERWASVALNIMLHGLKNWISVFNSSEEKKDKGGDYSTSTIIENVTLMDGKNSRADGVDRHEWQFHIRGTLEFVKVLSEGTEPIDTIEISTNLKE